MTILTVDGIASLDVEADALVIKHGFPRGQFTVTLQRQDCKIDRIVVASRHGDITLAAIQWMAAVGITWCVLSDVYRPGDENHYAVYPVCHSADRPRHALLRRAQAAAQSRPVGVQITRYLLSEKFAGQRDIAAELGSDVALEIDGCRQALNKASLVGCRGLESQVAKMMYWDAWKAVEIEFADTVPDHWRRFPSRTSSISGNAPRNAANPINALLNYAYGVLEGGTVSACYAMGLDPLLGILHTDQDNRQSMAADMMEPGRPLVDKLVLELIRGHKFRKSEFVVTSQGQFRLRPSLTKSLAVMVNDWLPQLYPVWEVVLNMLIDDQARGDKKARTPLTRANAKRRYSKNDISGK